MKMSETEKAIENLNTAKFILCNQQMLTPEMCIRIGQAITDAITLLKEHTEIVRCEDCKYFGGANNPCGAINIYTKPDWFCADGERKET